jgi:hypothetical protein
VSHSLAQLKKQLQQQSSDQGANKESEEKVILTCSSAFAYAYLLDQAVGKRPERSETKAVTNACLNQYDFFSKRTTPSV